MKLKGSYTIEAALLMTVLVPLLAGIVYLGFYLHNDALLQNAAYEVVVHGSLHRGEKEAAEKVEQKKEEILKGRLLGMKNIQASVDMTDKKITVEMKGTFYVPGMIMGILERNQVEISAESEMDLVNPSKTIIRLHTLKKLLKGGGI